MSTPAKPAPQFTGGPSSHLVRIRELVYQVAGIFYNDSRLNVLQERCERRMRATAAQSWQDYFDHLTVRTGRERELHELLNEITVGETCFFRNQPQLEAFRSIVLPEIVRAKEHLPFVNLRIWSAGCSTGEEPYSLAMILLEESNGLLKGRNFEILAIDLNDRSLEKASIGVYGDYSVRNVPPQYLQKYFVKVGDKYQVTQPVKQKVSFNCLNLLDDSRVVFLKGMDIVFCCNVLIYFDVSAKRRVIQHFYNNLLPGGYLFLGYSESLFGITDAFRLTHFAGATAYRKPESGARK